MYKEIIIIIVAVTLVVSLDIVTNNYTKETVNIMKEKLSVLREYIFEENKEKSDSQIPDIENEWDERYKILAFYLEHDELEKVNTELTSLKAFLNMEEYSECMNSLDKCVFILEHIQEKEETSLKSVF